MTKLPKFDSLIALSERLNEVDFRAEFGSKAWGLTRLPAVWQPDTTIICSQISKFIDSADDKLRREFFESVISHIERTHNSASVIVRSSATQETLLDRGRFLSLQLDDRTAIGLENAARKICDQFSLQEADGSMALIVQSALVNTAKGHLANYRRVSKSRNQWEIEIESRETHFVGRTIGVRRENCNSQRNSPPGELVPLPTASNAEELKEILKSVGAWLAHNIKPVVSVEWVLNEDSIWLVQCDDEVDPRDAVNPKMLSFAQPKAIQSEPLPPAPFELYNIGSGSQLRKLAALDDFNLPSVESLPRIFTCEADELSLQLDDYNNDQAFVRDLDRFAPDGIVLRSDFVGASGQSGMNLPRTDTISGNAASAWLKKTTREICDRGVDSSSIRFLMHRFIPARASAWSYAEPNDRYVRVDSLWGIPDGIQYFPHDTFEFDLQESRISRPTIDYKPFITWPTQGGEWNNLKVQSQKARSQSIPKSDVEYIAEFTSKVSKSLGQPAQIMWFCGFPSWSEFSKPLPWYRERHTERPRFIDAAPALPEQIIRTVADAEVVTESKDGTRKKLILIPNSDVIRDKSFIQAVAQAAKTGDHSVVLDGSPLAHAFHQLLELDVPVFSSRRPSRRRTIRKQEFGKLVRDRIPEVIEKNGDAVTFGHVPKTEKRRLLVAKAFEELTELAVADEGERVDELADLYEVITTLLKEFSISWPEIEVAAEKKRKKRGGFDDGVVLVGTNLPEQDNATLLPSSTVTRREVSSSRALYSATQIEVGASQISVPIAKLFESNYGVEANLGEKLQRIPLQIRIDGDRIVVSVSDKTKQNIVEESEPNASDELPL